jgi:imidazolonepropionase-like amidohydrolase
MTTNSGLVSLVMAAACATSLLAGPSQSMPGPVRLFSGATLIDSAGAAPVVTNAVLLVRDGKVEDVRVSDRPPERGAVDLRGKFIIPGLISTHAHISDINGLAPRAYTAENTMRQLGVFARYGVTTVWSLGGEQPPAFEARAAQNTATLDRARLYLAGEIVTATTPAAARAQVAKVAATKPDVIKIRLDDTLGTEAKMSPAVYTAVIDEAHKRGLRVAAHVFYLDDAKGLLRAGADVIAHSVRDRDIDDEFIALMKARNVPYIPTLTRELSTFVYESTPAFFSDPFFLREADTALLARLQEPARQAAMAASPTAKAYKAALIVAKRNLKKAADAGVLIAMGTDSGAFPERFEGYFEHLELELMVDAGMTPAQVLRASTTDAATAMRLNDVGRLTKGAWADFVVLDKNPLTDIRNTRSIASVWIAGNTVKR